MATKEETVKKKEKEKEEEGSRGEDGGSIKDSTLRYNKVHPWKSSARPTPLALSLRLAAAALRHSTYFVPQLY